VIDLASPRSTERDDRSDTKKQPKNAKALTGMSPVAGLRTKAVSYLLSD
jgi:hypothetical protein